MSLDRILRVLEYIDGGAQKYYTKIAQKIPRKYLGFMCLGIIYGSHQGILEVMSNVGLGAPYDSLREIAVETQLSMIIASHTTLDVFLSSIYAFESRYLESIDEAVAINEKIELAKKYTRVVRFPLLFGGLGFLGSGAVNVYHYVKNGQPLPPDFNERVTLGLSLLGYASSLYLKDQDPTLLDKNPFWKKMYSQLVEVISARFKSPQPIPGYT